MESLGVVADEFITAIDDHLWRIDFGDTETSRIFLLAFGKCRGREAIVPAQTVPVIDVFAENDDGAAVERALLLELREESVGGRTTRAALGSKEFDDKWMKAVLRILCEDERAESEGQ